MKYSSTRGGELNVTFEQAILSGYASDGGLYVPESIPKLSGEQLHKWAQLSYTQLVKQLLSLYVAEDEIPQMDLHGLVDQAFKNFTPQDIIPIVHLASGLKIAELFHGQTMAFKDLSFAVLGQMLNYFLEKQNKKLIILVGTSGDTGSAAIHGVNGLKFIDIIVLYPLGYCNEIQELQMTTVLENNVHCFAVEGTSDDLDIPIKHCFSDTEFCKNYNLCCLNSINWARVLLQTAHYFYIYFQIMGNDFKEIEVVVPTGAGGNIAGGAIAAKMGLPIRLVTTVNANCTIKDFIKSGILSSSKAVQKTLASAMDIQVPYNVERLLWLFSSYDTEAVRNIMNSYEEQMTVSIPMHIHEKMKEVIVDCHSASDEDIINAIRKCSEEDNYIICPQTATAVSYTYLPRENSLPQRTQVCIGTANPAKFCEAITAAGLRPVENLKMQELFGRKKRYEILRCNEDWTEILKNKIVSLAKK